MKKTSLAAVAILGATLGMGATPASVPQVQQQQQRTNEAVEKTPTTVRQGKPTALNPTGGYTEYVFSGRPPKEYGQYLQAMRLQKWNKKLRK
jgi:hypothetical protein